MSKYLTRLYRTMLSVAFFLICLLILLGSVKLTYQCPENNTYLQDDYDILYNTSFNLYKECTTQLDIAMDLYENELLVTDMCMEKLKECEINSTDLFNSVNYTNQIRLLKNQIELESTMLLLKKKTVHLEEKNTIAYLLISEYKEKINSLKNNLTDLIHELYAVDDKWNQCKTDLHIQVQNYQKIFTNLDACLEREEHAEEQKNKYVIRLTTCRKNNKKLKDKNAICN